MTDWRKIGIEIYIDLESINHIGENIFECWVKAIKSSYVFDNTQKKYNQKLGYQLCKYLIDTVNKTFAIKGIVLYDNKGQVIEQGNLNIMELEWTEIPPDSLASNIFDVVTGKISPELLQEYSEIMNPFLSVILVTIIGLLITGCLSIFIEGFYKHPLYPALVIAYTLHPIFRYKFNYNKMSEKHNLFRRFFVSLIIVHILFLIAYHGNKMASEGANQNITDGQQEYIIKQPLKTLSEYAKEGENYCLNKGDFGNSPFTCIMGYIEENADVETLNIFHGVERRCEGIEPYYEYKNCVYREIEKY